MSIISKLNIRPPCMYMYTVDTMSMIANNAKHVHIISPFASTGSRQAIQMPLQSSIRRG